MILSGSAWTDDTDVDLVVDVLVDGALVARGGIFSNAAATHRALVFPAVPLALAAGEHVVEIRAGNDETVSDAQDRYEITLVVR